NLVLHVSTCGSAGGIKMANIISAVPRLDDKTALAIFRELQGVIAPQSMSLQAAGSDNVNLLSPDEPGQQVIALLERQSSFLITHLGMSYQNFNISFHRNQDSNKLGSFYDEIRIDHQQNQPGLNQSQRLALVDLLN